MLNFYGNLCLTRSKIIKNKRLDFTLIWCEYQNVSTTYSKNFWFATSPELSKKAKK